MGFNDCDEHAKYLTFWCLPAYHSQPICAKDNCRQITFISEVVKFLVKLVGRRMLKKIARPVEQIYIS